MKNDFEDINELVNNLAAQMKDFAGDLKAMKDEIAELGVSYQTETLNEIKENVFKEVQGVEIEPFLRYDDECKLVKPYETVGDFLKDRPEYTEKLKSISDKRTESEFKLYNEDTMKDMPGHLCIGIFGSFCKEANKNPEIFFSNENLELSKDFQEMKKEIKQEIYDTKLSDYASVELQEALKDCETFGDRDFDKNDISSYFEWTPIQNISDKLNEKLDEGDKTREEIKNEIKEEIIKELLEYYEEEAGIERDDKQDDKEDNKVRDRDDYSWDNSEK